jgi:hypothetical protein
LGASGVKMTKGIDHRGLIEGRGLRASIIED